MEIRLDDFFFLHFLTNLSKKDAKTLQVIDKWTKTDGMKGM